MAVITSLHEAIREFLKDGDTVAMEGFTHLIPSAAGHEIIRQHKKNLSLVRLTPDLIYDQLIGAGCASTLRFSWGGNPGVGSLHRLRDAVENDWPQPLALQEHAHAGMAAWLRRRFRADRVAARCGAGRFARKRRAADRPDRVVLADR